MERTDLEKRLKELEAEERRVTAQAYRLQGAIAEVRRQLAAGHEEENTE